MRWYVIHRKIKLYINSHEVMVDIKFYLRWYVHIDS